MRSLRSTSSGEAAVNVDGRKTGLFSEVLRAELATAPAGTWPPDLDVLRDRIDLRFMQLRTIGKIRQVPSYLWYRGAQGGEEVVFSAVPSVAPRSVSLAALGELTDALLSIDEFAHEPSRWQIIRLMPREIASAVSSVGPQRLLAGDRGRELLLAGLDDLGTAILGATLDRSSPQAGAMTDHDGRAAL